MAFRGDSDGPNFPLFIPVGLSVWNSGPLPPRLGRLLFQELRDIVYQTTPRSVDYIM